MADITNALTMRFRTADDKTRLVTLQPCKASVTEAEVKDVMDAMISSGVFIYEPTEKLGAALTQRIVAELF